MASFKKLAFLFAIVSSIVYSSCAAPVRLRPRGDPPPAVPPVALTLKAQQDSLKFDFDTPLPLPDATITHLDSVPDACLKYNSPQSECTTQFEAVNVTYDDCRDPWTICRCTTANMTMDAAVDRLGKVPIGLRRFVANVLLLPGEPRAYTLTSGDVHVFGNLEVDAMVHESVHSYDWATGSPLSGTQEWQMAINSDSCVPDTYSETSATEDFAQVAVVKTYSMIYNNTMPPGFSIDCLSHQMQYMSSLPLFNKEELFGNTCQISSLSSHSRHSQPPLIAPTRIAPNLPPPVQRPVQPSPPSNSTAVAIPTAKSEDASPINDNAALSSMVSNVQLAILASGAVFGLLA